MASAMVRVSELRAAYMPGIRKLGEVNVSAIGLTYDGAAIAKLAFERHAIVRYYAADGTTLAVFQDSCGIDD